MGASISDANYLVVSFVFAVICFCLVSLYAILPLNGAIKYLKLLLNQPKTENIRVVEEGVLQNFKYAEWGELGELVQKVERKLRRRTKALLRETTELTAVMNSLDSPIISVNTRLEVAFLNSAFAVLFEIDDDSLDLIDGDGARKVHEVVREKKIIDLLEKAIETSDFDKKMIAFAIGERQKIFSVSMSPLRRGLDNSIYGLVVSFNDETVKVELDQKRMDFVANASHELRTPIAAVSTSVSLLNKVEDQETKDQIMDSLKLNSDRLVNLAEDLLDLSKLEDDAETFEAGEFDLKEMTEEVLMGLSNPKKNLIESTFEAEKGYFDGSKVKQVLTNLLRNALIYTPDDTKVEIKWYVSENADLCVQVKDWGLGVPEAEHDRIFERFYRVDKSRSRKSGGSGIGLSIVKHIMGLHEGDVKLLPYQKGEGATFICSFPQ
ncbi:MAG: sensor histidine kinase [Bdellovibrionales bacterium]